MKSNKNYKKSIIGTWENSDIKYVFYEKGEVEIYWKNGVSSKGTYYILNDNISITYGYNDKYWKGKIDYITRSELSILDLTNELEKSDVLIKVFPELECNSSLTKYVLEKTLIVFLILVHFKLIKSIDGQLNNFFVSDYSSWYYPLYGLLVVCIIFSFLLSFNIIYTLFKNDNAKFLIATLDKKKLKNLFNSSLSNIWNFIENDILEPNDNKDYKFRNSFLTFSAILIIFINGSPFINNYMGIYTDFEVPTAGSRGNGYQDYDKSVEVPGYVIKKGNKSEIKRKAKKLYSYSLLDSEYKDVAFTVSTRGYLFEQTAIIEGYESSDNYYKGFYFKSSIFCT